MFIIFNSFLKDKKTVDQPCTYPEVFLTFGAPGDKLVIPLSPALGRPLSLNLNLVPKEDVKSKSMHCSSNCASPRKAHSRSSPNPAPSKAHKKTSCMHERKGSVACPMSPKENSFSLIDKVRGGQNIKLEQRKKKGGGIKEKDSHKQ